MSANKHGAILAACTNVDCIQAVTILLVPSILPAPALSVADLSHVACPPTHLGRWLSTTMSRPLSPGELGGALEVMFSDVMAHNVSSPTPSPAAATATSGLGDADAPTISPSSAAGTFHDTNPFVQRGTHRGAAMPNTVSQPAELRSSTSPLLDSGAQDHDTASRRDLDVPKAEGRGAVGEAVPLAGQSALPAAQRVVFCATDQEVTADNSCSKRPEIRRELAISIGTPGIGLCGGCSTLNCNCSPLHCACATTISAAQGVGFLFCAHMPSLPTRFAPPPLLPRQATGLAGRCLAAYLTPPIPSAHIDPVQPCYPVLEPQADSDGCLALALMPAFCLVGGDADRGVHGGS